MKCSEFLSNSDLDSKVKKESYPKFLIKAESKILGGNMSVSILDEKNGVIIIAVTIFDKSGKIHYDSFETETLDYTLREEMLRGELINTLSEMYLDMQLIKKIAQKRKNNVH